MQLLQDVWLKFMIFILITENAVNLVVDAFFCLQKTNTMEKFACLLNLVFVVALNVSNDVYFDIFFDLDRSTVVVIVSTVQPVPKKQVFM